MPFLPYIPFVDCAEVAFIGTMGSQLIIFSLAVTKAGGFTGTDLDDIAAAAVDWYQTQLRGSLADDYELGEVKVTDLTTAVSPLVELGCAANCTGAVNGTAAPNNCAQVISLITAKRGRSYRGRIYLPAIPSAALFDASHITDAQVILNASAMAEWVDAMNGVGCTTVVLSRETNGVRRTVGEATPVTNFIPKSLIGTQRRRIAGRGA